MALAPFLPYGLVTCLIDFWKFSVKRKFMLETISFFSGLQFITLFAAMRPFCWSPILIVPFSKLGASL